ncbi:spr6p [Saccharomyces arboricola H-6]|uniref:Spr6p n=1 Tax=Saccharomyces arboricola (strain H-6 / AS 2.3317 / CBS 10644) TaxID=1160507 RepID=J8Q2V3_SACAR|nr:spr6p [Saccharomyces arboricola H-6]
MAVSYIWQSYSSPNLHWIYPPHTRNRPQNAISSCTSDTLLKGYNGIHDLQSNRMIELLLQGTYDRKRQKPYSQEFIPNRKKKTHIKKFLKKQKKSRKPVTLEQGYLSGPVTLRFGNFAGIRDLRGTRCPLHGIKHGFYPKPGERCACQQATLFPSPLTRVSCDQTVTLDWTGSSTRLYDNITDEFSSLYF